MDCQMPEWDGLTATRAIRERERQAGRGRLPVIALTANAMAGYGEVCREAGMDDYLTKPLRQEDLVDALARQLPGRAVTAERKSEPVAVPESVSASAFDIEKLSRICHGDRGQVAEMLRLFVNTTEDLLADLADAVANRDAARTARQAHQIKGAAAYLGAAEITRLAGETEIQAKAGDWPACVSAMEDLEAAFIGIRGEMEGHIGG
jgi:HPt (histidine-containing phosphotransfer) domain-containing protein